ncbi:MAG TPA: PIN domain-containing protein [Desulfuromonadaceae bacterium]
MSDGKVFVDTNILIYGYDTSAGSKHTVAAKLLADLWKSESGVLSTQVLQEFYVNVTRKIVRPLETIVARSIIEDLARWHVVTLETDTLLAAIDLQRTTMLSFWDAMIVAAAIAGGTEIIFTEDLNHGQIIGGVMVKNPFFVG